MAVKDTDWGQAALEAIKKGREQSRQYQDDNPTTDDILDWFKNYELWLASEGHDELPADPPSSSFPNYRADWVECQTIIKAVWSSARAAIHLQPNQAPAWFQEFYESLVELVAIMDQGVYYARNPDFCAQAPSSTKQGTTSS